MKIEIEISANFALLAALQSLTVALTGKQETAPPKVDVPEKKLTPEPEEKPYTMPEAEPEETKPEAEPEEKKLTETEKRKLEIKAQIESMGFVPPEKGSLKKFEAALQNAEQIKEAQEEKTEAEPETEEPEVDEADAPSLDEVRTLAHAVVKSTPESVAGKNQLAASLKIVGAKRIADATPAQLIALVPLLEKACKMSLAEAVEAAK